MQGLSNIYYTPEKFGLQTVGEVDRGDGYGFDRFVVWADADGNLMYDTDAGCSCPSPFENAGLGTLTAGSTYEVIAALDKWSRDDDFRTRNPGAAADLIERLRRDY